MSVEITFEQDGGHGLVAAGTSLWEAAKRLGVQLSADCNGRGECDACAVLILRGAELLSPPNDPEQKMLGAERLGSAQRLACQTKIERSGPVTARAMPGEANAEKQNESGRAVGDLTLGNQVSALIERQAVAITEAANTLREKSNGLIEKFLNLNSHATSARNEPEAAGESSAEDGGAPHETETSEQET
jgi:ferredoxin